MIPILFEDEAIVAIDKPAGISSIPEREMAIDSIVKLLETQLSRKLFVVHRLDKEVSGVMLFAKTAAAHKYLNEEFFNRTVIKTYAAVLHGVVADDSGVIHGAVRLFGSGRMGIDEAKGKPSETGFEVVQRGPKATLVNAFPKTGRRHQLRVHFYSQGHPIVGDRLYGDKTLQAGYPRLLLHAQRIAFTNSDKKELVIESPLPQLFSEQVRVLLEE